MRTDTAANRDEEDDPSNLPALSAPASRSLQAQPLTREGFARFLRALDSDRERAGEKYEQLRRTLIKFFRWRGAHFPEECADETLNRVIKKIARDETINDPSTYVYGVARMVLKEVRKEQESNQAALRDMPPPERTAKVDEDMEMRAECLKQCLDGLRAGDRELIVQYYKGDKGDKIAERKRLAEKFGLQPGALRIQAHRLRIKLEACINECLRKK